MSKKAVEIVCLLDRSGSMGHLKTEVISGFNRFLNEQKEIPGKAKLTLALFDDQYNVVYDRVKLKKVPELTEDIYTIGGMTALNDAIAKTINGVKKGAKKVIFLIQTDGAENSSSEFTNAQVKELIAAKEALGWEFVFIGAGIDAFNVGGSLGFSHDSIMNVTANSIGTSATYDAMSVRSTSYRGSPANTNSTDGVKIKS